MMMINGIITISDMKLLLQFWVIWFTVHIKLHDVENVQFSIELFSVCDVDSFEL